MKHAPEKFTRLVDALQQLPTIGQKSATRLAYHMLIQDSFGAMKIAHAIEDAVGRIQKCHICGALSDDELCPVCSDDDRDLTLLCIVDSAKDILTIEENGLFDGRYFVLDSLENMQIEHLQTIVSSGVQEVIFALTPSIANDAIMLYVEDKLQDRGIRFTRIAQGVPTGVSLENIDMLSLARALKDRVDV